MTPFVELSDFARAMFALWGLLLCVLNIGNAVLAAVRRRYSDTAFALVLFFPCYMMWQIIFDLSLFSKSGPSSALSFVTGAFPWAYWMIMFVSLSVASAFLLSHNIRYDRSYITPATIKLYLDKVPCGICCWRKNGRVLFSNICMNTLCAEITGGQLLNGNQFRDALTDDILSVSGKVWRFTFREIELDNERLFEMTASDITDEYAKTEALKMEEEQLSRLNSELGDYYLSIDESVKRQEILQAKMNIHDEMNRLMLSTMAADREDTEALDRIFSLWEQNALLLCKEADKKSDQYNTESLNSLANALGVSLIRRGELPRELDDSQKELFFITAQEALVNAVKHARADCFEIDFERHGKALRCRFTNNGDMPSGKVRFEGGLANISRIADRQNAEVHTEVGDRFTLVLEFKNHPNG